MAQSGMRAELIAGAAEVDITPNQPVFLWGYPRVPRQSTGVHDTLKCSALHLECGGRRVLFLANDLIFVPRDLVEDVRKRIAMRTSLEPEHVLISASHTHSGPMTVRYLSNEADPVVPAEVDASYMEWLADRMTIAAISAVTSSRRAQIATASASAVGIGTNRHDPAGPADLAVPAWLVRDAKSRKNIALMAICAMHPTVLHEDSTLISADFPGLARAVLHESGLLPPGAPFVYHMGASGNQSPRHVTLANTFAEARRLGTILGRGLKEVLAEPVWETSVTISSISKKLDLELRDFPDLEDAKAGLLQAEETYRRLMSYNAPRAVVRTAECDLFGAEETVALAAAARDGRVQRYAEACSPAEVQVIRLGDRYVVGWPGEHFVEFALQLKERAPGASVITLANGELQGYIVTEEAVQRGCYEAANALFAPHNAKLFIDTSLALIRRLEKQN